MTPINHIRLLGWERSIEAVELAPDVKGVLVVAEHRETGDYMYATPCLQRTYFSSTQEWGDSLFSVRGGHRDMTKVSELSKHTVAYELIELYGGLEDVENKLKSNYYECESHINLIKECIYMVKIVNDY